MTRVGPGLEVNGVRTTRPAAVGKMLDPPNASPDPLFTVIDWDPDIKCT